jgi:hypothetical protein
MRVIDDASRYDHMVRSVRVKRDDYLADADGVGHRPAARGGNADPRIDTRYSALAFGGMVAPFVETMFIGGQSFDLSEAVEQPTLLGRTPSASSTPTSARPVPVTASHRGVLLWRHQAQLGGVHAPPR